MGLKPALALLLAKHHRRHLLLRGSFGDLGTQGNPPCWPSPAAQSQAPYGVSLVSFCSPPGSQPLCLTAVLAREWGHRGALGHGGVDTDLAPRRGSRDSGRGGRPAAPDPLVVVWVAFLAVASLRASRSARLTPRVSLRASPRQQSQGCAVTRMSLPSPCRVWCTGDQSHEDRSSDLERRERGSPLGFRCCFCCVSFGPLGWRVAVRSVSLCRESQS